MPVYRYRAVDAQGIRREDTLTAASPAEAETSLRAAGYTVLSVGRPSLWNTDISILLSRVPVKRKIPLKELAVLCRKMAFLLDAGVPVKTTVPFLAEQSGSHGLRSALKEVHAQVMRGEGLSAALTATGLFPAFMCGLCAVGEMSARLPRVMNQLAEYYERQSRSEEELSAAMLYPAAVTVMMLTVIIVAVVFVLPGYTRVFSASGVALPALTRALMAVSEAVTRHAYALCFSFSAVAAALFLFLKSETGRVCMAHLRLFTPIIRVVPRQTVNLRLAQALSLLLASGQSLMLAVPVCAETVDNLRVRRDLHTLAAGLSEGRSFHELLSRIPYMDPLLCSMAQVGVETGRLPQTMEKCSEYFARSHEALIRRMNKLAEPIITIVLGLILGLIMLAVILPTFALTSVV